MNFVVNIV